MNATSHHRPRKRFGQHFLHDQTILTRMANAIAPLPKQHIVEIGPGTGALTEYLIDAVTRYDAIEIDRDLIEKLQRQFKQDNFSLHQADVLNFDFATLATTKTLRIIGNLPYNISTPLLFKLFESCHLIQDMHFLLQKEVVDRLTATVNAHCYGRLSVMAQYFCDNAALFDVAPSAFDPPPQVNSTFMRLRPHTQAQTARDFTCFSQIVQQAFNYRRKTLNNSLGSLLSGAELESLDIDPQRRPQTLSVADFIRISDAISVK